MKCSKIKVKLKKKIKVKYKMLNKPTLLHEVIKGEFQSIPVRI